MKIKMFSPLMKKMIETRRNFSILAIDKNPEIDAIETVANETLSLS